MVWTKTTESEKLIQYQTTSPENKISECLIKRNSDKKEITIVIHFNPDSYRVFLETMIEHPEFGVSQKHGIFFTDQQYQCALIIHEPTEKDVLHRFFDELSLFEQSLIDISPHFQQFCHFYDLRSVHQEIHQRYQSEGFEKTLQNAKQYYEAGIRDVFLVLAKMCHENNKMEEALESLALIAPDHHSGLFEAAKWLLSIQKDDLAIETIFKAGNDPVVQDVRDKLFAKITNAAAGLESDDILIRNVRLNDPMTLLALSHKLKEYRDQKQKYSQEKEQLEAALKQVKNQIPPL